MDKQPHYANILNGNKSKTNDQEKEEEDLDFKWLHQLQQLGSGANVEESEFYLTRNVGKIKFGANSLAS